jgi:hypothetical protein
MLEYTSFQDSAKISYQEVPRVVFRYLVCLADIFSFDSNGLGQVPCFDMLSNGQEVLGLTQKHPTTVIQGKLAYIDRHLFSTMCGTNLYYVWLINQLFQFSDAQAIDLLHLFL